MSNGHDAEQAERAYIAAMVAHLDNRHDEIIRAMETDIDRLRDDWAVGYAEETRRHQERCRAIEAQQRDFLTTFHDSGDERSRNDVGPDPGASGAEGHAPASPAPARALSPRTPIEIDTESGQALGEMTERATASAARRASIRTSVEQSSASERGMLRHIFGLNLPGRDRA